MKVDGRREEWRKEEWFRQRWVEIERAGKKRRRERGELKDTTPRHSRCGGNPSPQLADKRKS